MQQVFDRYPHGILVVEGPGRIIAANAAARQLVGDGEGAARARGGPRGVRAARLRAPRDAAGGRRASSTACARPTLRCPRCASSWRPAAGPRRAWITAAPLTDDRDRIVVELRPALANDRRRRVDPDWARGPRLRIVSLGRTRVETRDGDLHRLLARASRRPGPQAAGHGALAVPVRRRDRRHAVARRQPAQPPGRALLRPRAARLPRARPPGPPDLRLRRPRPRRVRAGPAPPRDRRRRVRARRARGPGGDGGRGRVARARASRGRRSRCTAATSWPTSPTRSGPATSATACASSPGARCTRWPTRTRRPATSTPPPTTSSAWSRWSPTTSTSIAGS